MEWQEKEGIFEKYLPYAMVFGVADKWAKAFAAHIEPSVPAWYVGAALLHFSAVDFTSRMNNLSHQIASVAAPKSSGSGGGGFSVEGLVEVAGAPGNLICLCEKATGRQAIL